jgi:hypothetical protein
VCVCVCVCVFVYVYIFMHICMYTDAAGYRRLQQAR